MVDLPPSIANNEIAQHCIHVTASAYQLPPILIGGILMVEGGRNGMANKNTNGSYDYGVSQINSAWLSKTKDVGVGPEELKNDSCKNVWTAGWIIRRCLNKFNGNFWYGVGCYHTGENPRTPEQLARQKTYALKVYNAINRIKGPFSAWLAKR